MELLIIKTCDRYIRVKPDEFLRVDLDKASVFPLDRLPQVKGLAKQAKILGYEHVRIKKLVLTEEELS